MSTWTAGHREMNQYAVTITFKKEYDDGAGGTPGLDVPMGFAFYAAIIVILLMIIALVLKLLLNCDEDERGGGDQESATENTGLLFSKDVVSFISYGTSEEDEDLESGKGSSSSSSEDLYDGRICVICYDDQRNCFFIPCGHCITCESCAKRIISEEIKTCPICRTFINKVRMLQIL